MSEPTNQWTCPGCHHENDLNFCPACGAHMPAQEVMSEDDRLAEQLAIANARIFSGSGWCSWLSQEDFIREHWLEFLSKARELLCKPVDRYGLEHAIELALGKTEDGTVTGEQSRAIVDAAIAYLGARPVDGDVAKLREELVQSRRLQVEAAQLAGCAMQERDEQRARAEKLTCDLAELRVELDALHSDYELQAAQVGRADKEMAEQRARAERAEAEKSRGDGTIRALREAVASWREKYDVSQSELREAKDHGRALDIKLGEARDELAEARRQPAQGGLDVGDSLEVKDDDGDWFLVQLSEPIRFIATDGTHDYQLRMDEEDDQWRRIPRPQSAVDRTEPAVKRNGPLPTKAGDESTVPETLVKCKTCGDRRWISTGQEPCPECNGPFT